MRITACIDARACELVTAYSARRPMTFVPTLLLVLLGLPAETRAQPPAPMVEYYHLDAVGSVRAVTNQSGQVVSRHDYFPFGEEYLATSGSDPIRFSGKERDAETELDYFGGRYYGSRSGRFTTIDPVLDLEAVILDPQRWNRYAYCLNNPLKFTDPDGRSPKLALLALKVGHALYKGMTSTRRWKGSSTPAAPSSARTPPRGNAWSPLVRW